MAPRDPQLCRERLARASSSASNPAHPAGTRSDADSDEPAALTRPGAAAPLNSLAQNMWRQRRAMHQMGWRCRWSAGWNNAVDAQPKTVGRRLHHVGKLHAAQFVGLRALSIRCQRRPEGSCVQGGRKTFRVERGSGSDRGLNGA